jgi:hypothetical protein
MVQRAKNQRAWARTKSDAGTPGRYRTRQVSESARRGVLGDGHTHASTADFCRGRLLTTDSHSGCNPTKRG